MIRSPITDTAKSQSTTKTKKEPTPTPPLPALVETATDLISIVTIITELAKYIITTVNEGKSVTTTNKKSIVNASEEILKAMTILPNTVAKDKTSATQSLEETIQTFKKKKRNHRRSKN